MTLWSSSNMTDENRPDMTRALIMFEDDVMWYSFIHITLQTAMNNPDQLQVINTNSGRKNL